MSVTYYYTSHHNWEWVFQLAIEKFVANEICDKDNNNNDNNNNNNNNNKDTTVIVKQVRLFKELPSSVGIDGKTKKPSYSLFRSKFVNVVLFTNHQWTCCAVTI